MNAKNIYLSKHNKHVSFFRHPQICRELCDLTVMIELHYGSAIHCFGGTMFVLVPPAKPVSSADALLTTVADRCVAAIAGGYRRRSAPILLHATQHHTRSHHSYVQIMVLPDLWPSHQKCHNKYYCHTPKYWHNHKNTKNVHGWHNTPNKTQSNGLRAGLGSWPHGVHRAMAMLCTLHDLWRPWVRAVAAIVPHVGGSIVQKPTVGFPQKMFCAFMGH